MSLRGDIIRLAHSKPELRKDLLPMVKRTGSEGEWSSEDVVNEALDRRVNGKTVRQHIQDCLRQYIILANETHGAVYSALKDVEGYSQTTADRKVFLKAVAREVEETWGDDPPKNVFAEMFALGRYIT